MHACMPWVNGVFDRATGHTQIVLYCSSLSSPLVVDAPASTGINRGEDRGQWRLVGASGQHHHGMAMATSRATCEARGSGGGEQEQGAAIFPFPASAWSPVRVWAHCKQLGWLEGIQTSNGNGAAAARSMAAWTPRLLRARDPIPCIASTCPPSSTGSGRISTWTVSGRLLINSERSKGTVVVCWDAHHWPTQ
jgi:hypothetical protein